jgi:hypothetical protein
LFWVTNQRLGISTGFENLCGPVVKAPRFQRSGITGMCPGPILVYVDNGKVQALAGLTGAALFGVLYERFPAWLRLLALQVATGDG